MLGISLTWGVYPSGWMKRRRGSVYPWKPCPGSGKGIDYSLTYLRYVCYSCNLP